MKNLLLPILTLSANCAFAGDDAPKPLEVNAELGLLNITGNTESSAVKAKLDIKQDFTHWRNSYLIEGLYKKDTVTDDNGTATTADDVKSENLSARKYFASAQTDYKLNGKHRGLFMYASYEYDEFSGYEYQATLAAGYSDRLFKTDTSLLDFSIGPGVAFSKADDVIDTNGVATVSESENTPILRLSAFYKYNISEGAKFTQTISSDIATDSDSNTKSKSETAITAQLSASFALKAAYNITHNSEVPEDIESTDASTSVTLVYSF